LERHTSDITSKCWKFGFLVGDHLQLRDFGPYGIIFINVCVVITHVGSMGEVRGAYNILVGRPEGRRPLGRPRRRWEDNIKMDLRG
jgi:hypothetical protein